jgi:hypothetical protein
MFTFQKYLAQLEANKAEAEALSDYALSLPETLYAHTKLHRPGSSVPSHILAFDHDLKPYASIPLSLIGLDKTAGKRPRNLLELFNGTEKKLQHVGVVQAEDPELARLKTALRNMSDLAAEAISARASSSDDEDHEMLDVYRQQFAEASALLSDVDVVKPDAENKSVFIRCEEESLPVLRSLGVETSDYDHSRCGVTADINETARTAIEGFPRDFHIEEPVAALPGEALGAVDDVFTVIGHGEHSRQLFIEYVKADDGLNAFATAAAMRPDAEFSVAIKGRLDETDGLTLPGEGLVCAETILEQDDVFGVPQTPSSPEVDYQP